MLLIVNNLSLGMFQKYLVAFYLYLATVIEVLLCYFLYKSIKNCILENIGEKDDNDLEEPLLMKKEHVTKQSSKVHFSTILLVNIIVLMTHTVIVFLFIQ
jgi:hypothetical protein